MGNHTNVEKYVNEEFHTLILYNTLRVYKIEKFHLHMVQAILVNTYYLLYI